MSPCARRDAFDVLVAIGATMSAVNHSGETPFKMHMTTTDLLTRNDDLVLSFAAAGHCSVDLDSPRIGALVIAGGGRVSAEAGTDRAIYQILWRQVRLFRLRAWQQCCRVRPHHSN
jgi:hypothetical protein